MVELHIGAEDDVDYEFLHVAEGLFGELLEDLAGGLPGQREDDGAVVVLQYGAVWVRDKAYRSSWWRGGGRSCCNTNSSIP